VIVVDSSTLISLARSGNVGLLADSRLDVAIPDVAWDETVITGVAAGYRDAGVIEERLAHLPRLPSVQKRDAGVLEAAIGADALVCDDIALGRRARSLGTPWLRTPDLVLLVVRLGEIDAPEGRSSIIALREAGRLDDATARSYLGELE
jgi:hypothetical protein